MGRVKRLFFIRPQQGRRQTIGGVNIVVPESPLHTQVAMIDLVIKAAVHAEYQVVSDVQVDLAADTTIWARRLNDPFCIEHWNSHWASPEP